MNIRIFELAPVRPVRVELDLPLGLLIADRPNGRAKGQRLGQDKLALSLRNRRSSCKKFPLQIENCSASILQSETTLWLACGRKARREVRAQIESSGRILPIDFKPCSCRWK